MYIHEIINEDSSSKYVVTIDNPIEVYDYLSMHAFTVLTNYTLSQPKSDRVINNTYILTVRLQKIVDKYTRLYYDNFDTTDKEELNDILQSAISVMEELLSGYVDPDSIEIYEQ